MKASARLRIAFHTLGCKLNRFETEAMVEAAGAAGLEVVPFDGPADAYVLNTCTVTGRSDAECRKVLRAAARRRPGALLAAVGCYAERDRAALEKIPGVRLVLGVRERGELVARLAPLLGLGPAPAPADDGGFPSISSFGGRTRAFVKVQDGCDHRCAYCVVWQVRGPSRSESAERVALQVERLWRGGFREVVLTGVHLGAWGRDLDPPGTLAGLLERLAGGPGPRLRLSSVEPMELSEELLAALGRHGRICRHLHVPLQSGSDAVLARMGRDYTGLGYARIVRSIAARLPGAALGADVIAGFPGETDDEFQETLALIRDLPLAYLHVFGFSPRPGTPAASMPGQVPRASVERRGRILRDLGLEKALAFRRGFEGVELECLVEGRRDPRSGLLVGVADNYLKVLFEGPDGLMNGFARVVVKRAEGRGVHGRMVE